MLGLLLVLTMVVGMFSACGKKNPDTPTDGDGVTPTTTEEPTPAEEARDLGGKTIQFANWWYTGPTDPTTQKEEDTLAYREEIQQKYNFNWEEVNIGTWGEYQEIMVTSVITGDPAADIFVMDQSFVGQPLQQGLLYDLNTLKSFDFSDEKWSSQITKLMSVGDSVYGMVAGKLEPRLGVFFNKRLFEEAGLDPEEPYNLQQKGEWTWDKFKELCAKLTRDVNNDGTPDTYAIASFSCDFFKGCVFSNGGEFISRDANGQYTNATSDPKVLEALQWGRSLYDEGYQMPQPEGSNWDWFVSAFSTSQVAMIAADEYKVSTWADMEDDWGFVLFPAGPQGDMCTVFAENIVVMPSGLDADYADDVAFAYNLWTEDTPGYEDDDWQSGYYNKFRDSRAVDETLAMMYEDDHGKMSLLPLIPGLSYGDICYDLDAGALTPAEAIEKVQSLWQSIIDEANGVE